MTASLTLTEGTSTEGVWVAGDARLLGVTNEKFIGKLPVKWRSAPVREGDEPARFALLSAEQLKAFETKGRKSFSYLQAEDTVALLLTGENSWVAYFKPQLSSTGNGTFIDVGLTAGIDSEGNALCVQVNASEAEPQNRAPSAWSGSAWVPLQRDCYLLIDIPTTKEHASGTRTKLMVMMAFRTFSWRDGRHADTLPWGKARFIVIEGRTITVRWLPEQYMQASGLQ